MWTHLCGGTYSTHYRNSREKKTGRKYVKKIVVHVGEVELEIVFSSSFYNIYKAALLLY